jgi:hypothetical protein
MAIRELLPQSMTTPETQRRVGGGGADRRTVRVLHPTKPKKLRAKKYSQLLLGQEDMIPRQKVICLLKRQQFC